MSKLASVKKDDKIEEMKRETSPTLKPEYVSVNTNNQPLIHFRFNQKN